MQVVYSSSGFNLNNRTVTFTNRSINVSAGKVLKVRLRIATVGTGGSLSVSLDVNFPGGPKHLSRVFTQPGSYQFGGWAGASRSGAITASGSITAVRRVTGDFEVVSFDVGEDVQDWS